MLLDWRSPASAREATVGADWLAEVRRRHAAHVPGPYVWRDDVTRLLRCAEALERLVAAYNGPQIPVDEAEAAWQEAEKALRG